MIIDGKLQNEMKELWQPMKEHVLENLKSFECSTYSISSSYIRFEVRKHIEEIKKLINSKAAYPYLYLNDLTETEINELLEKIKLE